jgi:FkbM family methyltransferase
MGRKLLAGLRRVGIEPLAFSDNSSAIWGTRIEGIEVLSPTDAAKRFGDRAIFVIAIWGRGSSDPMSGRFRKLRELGCQRVTGFGALFWKYPEIFLPCLPAMDLPHKVLEQAAAVRRAFGLLADDRSRLEFVAQLRWRLFFDFDALPDPVGEPIYFPDLVKLHDEEVYVDCGAYDGDTIKDFLIRTESRFRGVVAFEPDPISLGRLKEMIDGLPEGVRGRIRVVPAAAGAQKGVIRFAATGELGSAKGGGDLEVALTTLDEAFAADAPTFIKMDIEAAEPEALRGARNLIRCHAPVLAICAYHQQDHLWTLPNLIGDLNPEYRVFLRPHIQQVEDLVCYAVPPHRGRE